MNNRSKILNAFTPNSEVEEPLSFAGRKDLVLNLTDSLLAHGSCPVIYGERGLGKTSLALQIARIALGDDQLLTELRQPHRALSPADAFVPFWVSCSKEVRTKNSLLQRIINTAATHESLNELAERRLKSVTDTHKLKLSIYEAQTKREFEQVHGESFTKLNVEEKLLLIVDQILASGAPGVLFVIDELDRVSKTDGLGDFLKNASSKRVKFLLVGVAQDISSLLVDHKSISRKLQPAFVTRMGKGELSEIIDKTLMALRKERLTFTFAELARARLVDVAGGYPWFVHCVGQEALLAAYDDGRQLVSDEDVALAIGRLSVTRFAQQYSDLFNKVVRDSRQREIVLRLFAKWPDYDIPVGEIYYLAKKLGVSNPAALKADLLKQKNGSILVSPPDHKKGIVRFRDAVFKRYLFIRDSIFEGVKEELTMHGALKNGAVNRTMLSSRLRAADNVVCPEVDTYQPAAEERSASFAVCRPLSLVRYADLRDTRHETW